MPGKPLSEVLTGKWLPSDVGDATVTGLCLDHRQLSKGDLFIALAGTRTDGRRFINEAVNAGAAAVVKEADNEDDRIRWIGAVPVIPYSNLAQDVSAIADEFFGKPSRSLNIMGVTGTNGKSTCTHLLAQLSDLLGGKSAVVGTLGYGIVGAAGAAANSLVATGLTTADPVANQRILAELKESGAEVVAMEISSHSLDQHRVAAVQIKAALFTNLTRDHLDYHGSMEQYGLAKRKLFIHPGLEHRVFNLDDAFGRELAREFKKKKGARTWTYALADNSADLFLEQIEHLPSGTRATLVSPWGRGQFSTALLGDFNLSNLLGVIAVCCAQGKKLNQVLEAISELKPVAGRMEQVSKGDIQVIVDYAHTPDSLEQALKALRPHTRGKLYCVFGCGGDRDSGKRPLMAAVAEQFADQVIVTSDNPRTESQERITADIRAGFKSPEAAIYVEDRRAAIEQAINSAQSGDCVLIAGKGHETYQQVGENRLPFSDVKHARLALQARNSAE
ncbi:UDP-N-acetylmuramoyl-L-alanyl-D-glutamate--2,6-diaminopimelate ligase [Proteobacteria bacterium 005FR1]|nr:UDP-N-acetylmuramoyl-L-alanyl-D-glutamate--2,6-diaminopimelate ligase [Proteobacteria bacterium 005FR1]